MGISEGFTVGFRPLQAAHDLVHLAQRADEDALKRLAHGVPSSDMSADDALATLSDLIFARSCRIETDDALRLHETLLLAATLPDDDFDAFELATMILLADRLKGGRGPDNLFWHWDAFCDHYRLGAAAHRAALINEYIEAERAGRLPKGSVNAAPVTGVDVGRVREDLRAMAGDATDAELGAIAAADYGDRTDEHLAAIQNVITEQGCVLKPDQSWVPSEVLELAAYDPEKPGFAVATAVLLVTVMARGDEQGWFDYRWEQFALAYQNLPDPARWAVLSAVRYLYETDIYFEPYPTALFDPVEHRAHLIPHLTIADRP